MPRDLLATKQPRDLLGATQPQQPDELRATPRRSVWEMSIPELGVELARNIWADPRAFARGSARGADDLARSVAEGATLGWADEAAAAADAALGQGTYEENLAAQQARDAMIPPQTRVIGNVAGGAALAPLTPTAAVSTIPRMMAVGGGTGAVAGAGFAEPGERLEGAQRGAMTGAGTAGLIGTAGRVIAPRSSPAVQALKREGVEMTPGQAAGGIAKRMEEKLTSIPGPGDLIRNRMTEAMESFNIGAINHALRPAGVALKEGTKAGRSAIAQAQDQLSAAYKRLLAPVRAVKFDAPFAKDMQNAVVNARQIMSDDVYNKAFLGRIRRIMKGNQRSLSGDTLNDIRSELGREARRFQKSPSPADQDVADAFLSVRDAIDDLTARNMSPDAAAELNGLRQAYAAMTRVERAAAAAGSKEGIFTPAALRAATKAMDTSARSRRFARGDAMMQGLAESAEEVLGNTVPNSGTVDRAIPGALLGAGAYIEPTTLLGAGAVGAPYVYSPLTRAMSNLVSGRQGPFAQQVGNAFRRLAIPGAAAAAVADQ